MRLIQIFLLLLSCHLAFSLINKLNYDKVPPGSLLFDLGAMYNRQEAPAIGSPGNGNSYIRLLYNVTQQEIYRGTGHMEFLVFHASDLVSVGTHTRYGIYMCCTMELLQAKMCTKEQLGYVMMKHDYLEKGYYRLVHFYDYKDGLYINDTFQVKKTGVHYSIILNCENGGAGNVKLVGETVYMNPFGYLSAELYNFLPLYSCTTLLFGFLAMLWLILCFIYRQNLTIIQKIVFLVAFFGAIESIFLVLNYTQLNKTGMNGYGILFFASLSGSTRRTMLRFVVMLISAGHTITRIEIEDRKTKMIIAALLVSYFVFSIIDQFISVLKDSSQYLSNALFFLLVPNIIINSLFYFWTFMEISKTLNALREDPNEQKLKSYFVFLFCLVSLILFSVFVLVSQMVIMWRNFLENMWRAYWIFDGYWQTSTIIIICVIGGIWRPSKDNLRWIINQNEEDSESAELENQQVEMNEMNPNNEEQPNNDQIIENNLNVINDDDVKITNNENDIYSDSDK